MARKWLKVTGWIAGTLVVLMVLAAILVPLLVPREQLRAMAEERAREATGGEVSLGPLSVSVFPRLRLVLGESSASVTAEGLREAGQLPGPLDHGEASLERLEVDLALWPLLRRNLEFGEVRVVSPRVELTTVPPAPDEPGAPDDRPADALPAADAGGVGLALAAVEVQDGSLRWREAGTSREVVVTGWQQELTAPFLGDLMTRLQRLGGSDLPPDDNPADAVLQLETRVVTVTFSGFAEQPLPELADVRLRAELALAPAADRARLTLHELTVAGLSLEADGGWDAQRILVDRLAMRVGEAGTLEGRASLPLPAEAGPLQLALSGPLDLARVLDLAEPWLPESPTAEQPLPELAGSVTLDLEADLASAPPLADAPAWLDAWRQGLSGRVEARAAAGRLTVTLPGVADPLVIGSADLVADLASPQGRTRVAIGGLEHPAARGDLSLEFVLPPSSGPLLLKADLTGDLGAVMAALEPMLPPRPDDAPALPTLGGSLALGLDVDLPLAPALTDSAAWMAAWQQGLGGRADLSARGGPLTIAAAELGDPLTIKRLRLAGDLRGPSRASELVLEGISHQVLRGDAALTVVPGGSGGVPALRLTLDEVDLDAVMAINQARQAAADQQARGWAPVRQAWADQPPTPVGELIPADLDLDLHAEAGTVRLKQTPYREVSLDGTLRARVIDVPSLAASLGTGRIAGSARVDYAEDPTGHASWQATVTDVPASALLEPYAGWLAAVWTGALNAELSGDCGLADPEVVRRTLSLTGDLRGTEGSVDLRQQLSGVSKYLGSRQDLLQVTYNRLRQHVVVDDGKVLLQDLAIDGTQTDWSGDGWVSLDGGIELGLHVKLPAGFTPDLGDLSFLAEGLRDDQGRIGLDLKLTGQARSPAVGLDVDPAALLQQEDLRKRLQEEAQKGLGGLLDRLKGR